MAYGARLESVFTRKGIEGSNPSPSARNISQISIVSLQLNTEITSGQPGVNLVKNSKGKHLQWQM